MPHWPQIGVGAVVCHEDRLLLVLRGKSPNKNQWAIPGGKVKPGESLKAAVEREILEETSIAIRAGGLAWHFEFVEHDDHGVLRYHYVVLDFFAEYLRGELYAGDDAADARWIRFDELEQLELNPTTRELLAKLYPHCLDTRGVNEE